jgi:proteasome accessory factor A
LENGREYSPIEIQREYCELAKRYMEQYPVSDQIREGVGVWEFVLDCLDDDPDKLDTKIDWVIKRRLIREYTAKRQIAWHDPRVFMIDLQYHDIRRDRGFFYMLERKGRADRLFTDAEIEKAKTEPPQDTRARMRGDFIKLARQNNIQYDLDWSNIRLGNLLNVRVICNNPFETDTEKVTELVRTIQKTNLRRTSLSKLVIQS